MKNWETESEELVFSAPPFLDVRKQSVRLPDDNLIEDFFQVHLRSFVIVVPVTKDGKVLTIRQYKHGPGRVSLTFPGGFLSDGEPASEAIGRELLEETGYEAGDLIHLGEFVDNGNQRGCVGNYYVALNCQSVTAPNSGDLEEMVLQTSSPEEIDQALFTGDIAIIHNASVWAMARLRGLV